MDDRFCNKSAAEIIADFTSILDNKGTAIDIAYAFEALKKAAPSIQQKVINELEDQLISQAKQDGKAWADVTAELEIMGEGIAPHEEKYALLDDLERLKPMTEALLYISCVKGDGAQLWTKTFAKEYMELSGWEMRTTTGLANLYADACEAAEDIRVSQEFEAAHERKARASLAEAHVTAAGNQQKLNKLAAAHKLRIG